MKVIGELNITDNKKLVLSIGEFRGVERIDLREHFLNKDGNYGYSKRGVNFSSEWLPAFVKIINRLNDV